MWARIFQIACSPGLVLALSVTWVTPVAAQADLPEQFVSIKQFLLETVSESQRVGAATTQTLLKTNLAAFQQLKQRVDQAARVDDIIAPHGAHCRMLPAGSIGIDTKSPSARTRACCIHCVRRPTFGSDLKVPRRA